jgi:outer membrane protein TolC
MNRFNGSTVHGSRFSLTTLFIITLSAGFSAAGRAGGPLPESTPPLPDRYHDAFIASAGTDVVLRIGISDCVAYALKQNSEILIRRIDPLIRADGVAIEEAAFEPALNAGYAISDSSAPTVSSSLPETLDGREQEIGANVSGKLTTGMQYTIGLTAGKSDTNLDGQRFNPSYTAEPAITITQPLLQGFGPQVNRAAITIAQNDLRRSSAEFQDTAMDVVTKALAAYYAYVFSIDRYALDELSLARARDLLKADSARYAKGIVSSVDLLENEAAVAQREKALISSEASLKTAEDDLKYVTNLVDDPRLWNARIEPIEQPRFSIQTAELGQALISAFSFRPDYRAALIGLENYDIRITTAKNALLPVVDLFGAYALNGLGEDWQDSFGNIESDLRDWSAGVTLRVPWGGGDRANLRQKEKEKAQALLNLRRLEQTIVLEVRNRVRAVDTQRRQVEAAASVKEKETQNYAAQRERYAAGQVSTHDMLDYQDKLTQAELDYLRALLDYSLALITFDRSQGLTLTKNYVQIEE